MFAIAYCSIFAAQALYRYFFPSDLKENKTNVRPSVKSSKNDKKGFKAVKKCSLPATKQSPISSYSNNRSQLSDNLTTTSSSTDERSPDKRLKFSPTVDETFISPSTDQPSHFPEESSILRSAKKTSPSIPSSADQRSLSASDYKTSHFLSANETSLQSSDQSSACRAADKNSTANQENSSSALPLDVPSNSSISGSSRDEKSSCSFDRKSSTLPLEAQSNSASVADSQTGSPVLAHAISDGSTDVEGSCVVKTITETLDEIPPSDPSPSCSMPFDAQSNSASVADSQTESQVLGDAICGSSTKAESNCVVTTITETLDEKSPFDPSPSCSMPSGSYACETVSSAPTCVSESAAIRPLMSIVVTPPAIPSLMSIKTTPPPFWCGDYSFGPRFPTPYRNPMPRNRGASRPHRNTSSARAGVRQTAPIPALMSIETFPPVGYNGTRPFNTNGIQTRPPWGTRPPRGTRPSRGNRPPRGTRRPQARGPSERSIHLA